MRNTLLPIIYEKLGQQLAAIPSITYATMMKAMALIFRWYLGLSSRWSNIGEPERKMDYQILAGPSLGVFNAWATNTAFAKPENRKVAEIDLALLQQAARQKRLQLVEAQLTFSLSMGIESICILSNHEAQEEKIGSETHDSILIAKGHY